jgi:hypothetical protein
VLELLLWLEGTAVADAVRTSIWMYPAFESTHYVGIALLVGGIMVIDLRLLGFAPRLPIAPVMGLLPWVLAGFLINLVTGTLMFIYGATSYGTNWLFWYKMGLILLAGANALLFKVLAGRSGGEWMRSGEVPVAIRAIATLSLVLWVSVTAAGRFMAYVY